jgi:hypothetical protein
MFRPGSNVRSVALVIHLTSTHTPSKAAGQCRSAALDTRHRQKGIENVREMRLHQCKSGKKYTGLEAGREESLYRGAPRQFTPELSPEQLAKHAEQQRQKRAAKRILEKGWQKVVSLDSSQQESS